MSKAKSVSLRRLLLGAVCAILAVILIGGQSIAQSPGSSAKPGPKSSPSASADTNGASPKPSRNSPANSVKTTSTKAEPTNAEGSKPAVDRASVISYLGELISWYRHLQTEERLATEPAETLFVADDRQSASRILELGFQYADAAAKILNEENSTATGVATSSTSNPSSSRVSVSNLVARRADAESTVATANAKVKRLKDSLKRARSKQREVIQHQIATAQTELSLAQSQVDALTALINFENGSSGGSDFQAQIDQLRSSIIGPRNQQGQNPAPAVTTPSQPRSVATATGMVGQAEKLIALTQKSQDLDYTIELTKRLLATSGQLQIPLHERIEYINQRMLQLAANSTSGDLAAVKDIQDQVAKLTAEHKLVIAALLPLSMQKVVLTQYIGNLERWRSSVTQRSGVELRNLLLRVGGLLLLLIVIIGGAALWRRATFRYVHDMQRRHQLIQLSRIIVVAIIALVLLFDFANELGALATVMGFAAAGIALTLQNVIISLAGYFYISGRYGIRVGDRVQISNTTGDVIEIGLFKMTLMELGSDDTGHQPTGRVTVFPNSVVFQPSGSFSKQLPGSDFAWNELRITLAPECDYRLAERKLVEIVSDVFRRYRDTLQREYRTLERNLNQPVEPPRPQSRLRVSETGIELVIRYPVQFRSATQTADEIARRMVDALKREPALKLATPGTPMIQAVESRADEHAPEQPPNQEGPAQNGPAPVVDNNTAATAAAAAAGATIAKAFVETSAAEQKREGITPPPVTGKQ
ncbi:MAG TPA: hypothetical protein VJ728_02460 [Candidatus Binataceae bacterium]|nr:hypothetical protein [Candidatus Binataceae bacterium]